MQNSSNTGNSRSISIGGNVDHQSVVVAGDGAHVIQTSRLVDKDMHVALTGLRDLLVQHISERAPDIAAELISEIKKVIDDAMAEMAQAKPDPNRISKAIETVLTYAGGAAGLDYLTDKLTPHLRTAADWLGQNWQELIKIITSP